MEACNLILCPHPLRQPNFEESCDQPQPGSFPKKDPGYEVARNYDVLTDEQKCLLKPFYDDGTISTAKDKRELIVKASDQAGTSYEKVKVSE
jgi:hypothetical protein